MAEFRNVGRHTEDLADGRVVAVDDVASLDEEQAKHPHNKRLIDEGILVKLKAKPDGDAQAAKKPATKGA